MHEKPKQRLADCCNFCEYYQPDEDEDEYGYQRSISGRCPMFPRVITYSVEMCDEFKKMED